MIESRIQTKVSAPLVWQSWHRVLGMDQGFAAGKKGKAGFRYKILEVKPGHSFTLLWKSLFVRLAFTHSVFDRPIGSEIVYQVKIIGLLAWPVRFLLKNKIRRNLDLVLKAHVKELEIGKDAASHNRRAP